MLALRPTYQRSSLPLCLLITSTIPLPYPLLVPTRYSVLADEVGRSLYEELDFRIEVRCGHAALWSRCACPVQQGCSSRVCS